MGTLYIDTGGAITNSGSTDQNAANLSGALAVQSGADVVLDGSPDLSGVVTTPGPTQSSIYLVGATNANKQIFWITATANSGTPTATVTVDSTPTGTLAGWAIGGRFKLTGATQNADIEGALRAGDTVIFNNSPAAQAAVMWWFRLAGTSAAGPATIKGKAGARPVLNTTTTTNVIYDNAGNLCKVENVELDQDGASGAALVFNGSSATAYNVKVSDAGGIGIQVAGSAIRVIANEITGVGANGVQASTTNNNLIYGNNIHDLTGVGVDISLANGANVVCRNIIDTCTDRGILHSGASTTLTHLNFIEGNTIYGCGNSGLEVADADTVVVLLNNIFSTNGPDANEYNVEWVAGAAEYVGFHAGNIFYYPSGSGANLLNLTVNAQVASSEFTTDPQFTNPAAADFSLGSDSPAKATGFPTVFLGGNTNYLDMGPIQRQEAGGGGGGGSVPVVGGMTVL